VDNPVSTMTMTGLTLKALKLRNRVGLLDSWSVV